MLSSEQNNFVDEYLSSGCVFKAAKASGIQLLKEFPDCYYIYFLIEQETGRIFYVGKGVKKRALQHFRPTDYQNFRKKEVINEIIDAGNTPTYVIFHTTDDENQAYKIEGLLIGKFLYAGITNQVTTRMSSKERDRLIAKAEAKRLIDNMIPLFVWVNMKPRTQKQVDSYHEIYGELTAIATM